MEVGDSYNDGGTDNECIALHRVHETPASNTSRTSDGGLLDNCPTFWTISAAVTSAVSEGRHKTSIRMNFHFSSPIGIKSNQNQ